MVFYFSGTGNSLWVARRIGSTFYEKAVSVAEELKRGGRRKSRAGKSELVYTLRNGERVFFVFPVHSWGPAVLIKRFVARLRFKNYRGQAVYAVCTCGNTCGDTDKLMAKWLSARGIGLSGCYCLFMPNTYILMKGFGLDAPEVEKAKLEEAPRRLEEIIRDIREHGNGGNFYNRGSLPLLKSHIIYPLFARFAGKMRGFHTTEGVCTGCGLCALQCPVGNIHLKKKRPVWGEACVQCTACIHLCPVRAIEFKNITQKEARYRHPELKTAMPPARGSVENRSVEKNSVENRSVEKNSVENRSVEKNSVENLSA